MSELPQAVSTAALRKQETMQEVDREDVRRLLAEGAQLVEVLPSKEYQEDHLPDAINLPLRQLEAEAQTILDRNRAVIVYCWDSA